MSFDLGDVLPPHLLDRLGGHPHEDAELVVLICSVDAEGSPHPAMLSSRELVAVDPRTIRLATYAESRTTAHLRDHGKVALMIVNEQGAFYVQAAARLLSSSLRSAPDLAGFELRVTRVRSDAADPDREGPTRILSGITIARSPGGRVSSAAVLAELRALTSADGRQAP